MNAEPAIRSLAYLLVIQIAIVGGVLPGCDRSQKKEISRSAGGIDTLAAFSNRVWQVTDSPSGATHDLYVFLSDGTFINTAPEAVPQVGKWSLDGDSLIVVEGGLPYAMDILALADTLFHVRCRHLQGSYELRLAPATPARPTRPVEFNPGEHSISAHGESPAWLVTIDGASASLRMFRESYRFTGGLWTGEDAASWRFDAFRPFDGGVDTLSLIIRTELCDVGGAIGYPLSAMLIRGGQWLRGCAVAGWPGPGSPKRE